MSKRILITFGGRAYDQQTQTVFSWAQNRYQDASGYLRSPVDDILVFDDRWLIGTPFYQQNRWIFDRKPQHGFGFCSWKPYIIQHALRCFCETGDVVMYLDADTYPIADISCLFEMAERDRIVLFEEQGCQNRVWIKEECFRAMGFSDAYQQCRDAMHACGRFQLFRKGDHVVNQFLEEWQTYSLNPECQFHGGSKPGIPDDPSFIRNSCEQSVLSLLAHKYGIPLHRTPDQNGFPIAHNGTYKPNDKYPQLFLQVGARGNVNDLSGSRFRNVE